MKATMTQHPVFENSKFGIGGGFAIIKRYWEQLELSLLYAQMDKHSGLSAWKLLFVYVCGLLNGSGSVNAISQMVERSPMLGLILGIKSVTQCALSRFTARKADWRSLASQRLKRVLSDPRMRLVDGDVIAIDDTKLDHPFGKHMPFLCWLFDSSEKVNVWCMNLLTTLAVRENGLEFPLSWRFWKKPSPEQSQPSKIELAMESLLEVRAIQPLVRLWVAMDRWFLCKDLFRWLEARCFDWVTKAKSNTVLYQLTGCDYRGIPRYRSVTARMLLIEHYNLFVGKKNDRLAIPIPDIYMKMPVMRPGRNGRLVYKQELVPIAAVAICQLPEDVEQPSTLKGNGEKSLFRGTHLIISNRVDAPGAAVNAYTKRWRIEVFYRAAKQELGLNACRSETEHAHFAHIEMIFVAETLLRLVMHEYQDSSGQRKGDEVVLTHGQVIQDLIIASVFIELATPSTKGRVHTQFGTTSAMFSRFILSIWPKFIELSPWNGWNQLPATA